MTFSVWDSPAVLDDNFHKSTTCVPHEGHNQNYSVDTRWVMAGLVRSIGLDFTMLCDRKYPPGPLLELG